MLPEGQEIMAIFASNFGIEMLRQSKVIFVDGTFQTCPTPFKQLFILMAQLTGGSHIPVVFGLLPNKPTPTYLKIFKEVAGLAEDMFKGECFIQYFSTFNIYPVLRIRIRMDPELLPGSGYCNFGM